MYLAIEYYIKSLKINLKVYGSKHYDTAISYNNIAGVYYSLDNYTEALEYYNKALEIFIDTKVNHPYLASTYSNIGALYSFQGYFEKALEYHKKSLDIFLKVYGEKHPDTIRIYDEIEFIRNKIFLGKNPHLPKIKIENFKLLKNFEIEFTKNINIIIGENSSGKTSLLQAITLGLLEKNYSVGEGNEPYIKYITKSKSKAKIKLSFDEYEKNVTIFNNRREIDKNLYPFVLAYGSNIFTNYDNKLADIVQNIIDKKITDGFVTSIFKDYASGFYNPKSIINELNRIDTDRAKELKNLFINTINDFQDDFNLVSENNTYFFQDKDNTVFKLEDLSEGYRNNILLISDILIRVLGTGQTPDTAKGIILIDEFDRHLHPKWQTNLISKLKDVFPNIQFILTTHNPMSILDRESDEITILRQKDGRLEAVKDIGTKNIDVGIILLKYFNVESLVGKTMRNDLKEITEIRLKGRRNLTKNDKERLKELKDRLEYTPATDFIYNRAYFNFLIFLKENKNIDFNNYENMKDEEMLKLMEDYKGLF